MRGSFSHYKIVGYVDEGQRSQALVKAFIDGARSLGLQTVIKQERNFIGKIDGDIAVIYGLRNRLKSIMDTYIAEGRKCIFIDLGFFGRVDGGKLEGYHRVSVNQLFPTLELVSVEGLPDRFKQFNIPVVHASNSKNKYILLAGMSAKSAGVYGLNPEQWEREAIATLNNLTNLPIVYRPKPSWPDARPLPHALYSPPQQNLTEVLTDAACVVTHHSNVAIDAAILGIPSIVTYACTPSVLASKNLADIHNLKHHTYDERIKFLQKVAYQQWSVNEFRTGACLKYLAAERGMFE